MGVGQLLSDIFTTNVRSAEAVVQASFIAALEAKDQAERDEAQRLIDWYNRDRTEIIKHLTEASRKSFDSVSDWVFPIANGVPRTIRRLAMSYHEPPVREFLRNGKPLTA